MVRNYMEKCATEGIKGRAAKGTSMTSFYRTLAKKTVDSCCYQAARSK